jgi:hypothetical protein
MNMTGCLKSQWLVFMARAVNDRQAFCIGPLLVLHLIERERNLTTCNSKSEELTWHNASSSFNSISKRTEEQAIKGGTATAPTYRNLATKGLLRKDYLNGDAGTVGVYLWESRQAAEAWFTASKLTERFGARPRLTWYDTHVTVDNLKGETRVNRSALTPAAE